jgi:hypothetical protein
VNDLTGNISRLSLKDSPMTSINITAAEPNKVDAPAQPSQNPQQNQQPGDQSQQQGGAPNTDKPAQQK